MPNQDGTGNTLDGLKRIGGFLLVALILILVGTSKYPGWLFVTTPITTGIFSYFAAGQIVKNGLIGAAIGLAAGALFYLAV